MTTEGLYRAVWNVQENFLEELTCEILFAVKHVLNAALRAPCFAPICEIRYDDQGGLQVWACRRASQHRRNETNLMSLVTHVFR